jgi:hypothetical protein
MSKITDGYYKKRITLSERSQRIIVRKLIHAIITDDLLPYCKKWKRFTLTKKEFEAVNYTEPAYFDIPVWVVDNCRKRIE